MRFAVPGLMQSGRPHRARVAYTKAMEKAVMIPLKASAAISKDYGSTYGIMELMTTAMPPSVYWRNKASLSRDSCMKYQEAVASCQRIMLPMLNLYSNVPIH